MILIKKGIEPPELETYRRTPGASYDYMPSDIKEKIRKNLLAEQGGICAYCMKKIKIEDCKIEHYHAREQYKDEELIYSNMLGVCKGKEGYNITTCDNHRKSQELTIDPRKESDMESVFYDKLGNIYSSNPACQRDMNEILNLNCAPLVYHRKSALKELFFELEKHIGKNGSKKQWYETYYNNLLNQKDQKSPYVGILLWYLRKKVGK